MDGQPASPAAEFAVYEAAAEMTADEIDETLSAMARASTALLQECEAAQQRMEEWDDLSEAEIRDRAAHPSLPYRPERVLLSIRLQLATDSAKRYRDAAREFVSWWTDVAMAAWKSAVLGTPIVRARVGGAAPGTLMTKEELALLPTVDEHTRQLLDLSAFLGVPNGTGDAPILPDDEPEARRQRLWGDFWIEHRIPALPEPQELDLLLARTPEHAAERLRTTAEAVIRAALAGQRISEMEDNEGPWTSAEMAEYDRLSEQLSSVTTRLADFAQAITMSLPEVRAAHSGRSDDRG
ncbi:hypothetical protein OG800_24415 [Streptomyces sp. NBC_00445]|uniref:hypothetical protein n=1 Tax=Streptomyces sp. NBC_00445 TaxID=2975745 RepID=UPI002E21E0A2